MLKIGDKTYSINMKKLMEWVATTPSNERNVTTVITQAYPIQTEDDEMSEVMDIASKEITENKSTMNETMNAFRYDLTKRLIETILSIESTDLNEWSFAQTLSFNTLLTQGIITVK